MQTRWMFVPAVIGSLVTLGADCQVAKLDRLAVTSPRASAPFGATVPSVPYRADSRDARTFDPPVLPKFQLARLRRFAVLSELEMLELEAAIPGFGGIYLDKATREPVIWLVDRRKESAALVHVRPFLALRRINGARVHFRTAQYSFAQLLGHRFSARALFAVLGVNTLGVDHRRNRVLLTVADQQAAGAARAVLKNLGIPTGAVEIEIQPAFASIKHPRGAVEQNGANRFTSLSAAFRPVVPAAQFTHFVGSTEYMCSIGFNAYSAHTSGMGFVSASHCSPSMWVNDTTVPYYQPNYAGGTDYRFARKVYDPAGFTCPNAPTKLCRYSDAAIYQYVNGTSGSYSVLSRASGLDNASTDFGGTFALASHVPSPVVSDVVDGVGRTTGWNRRDIIATAWDIYLPVEDRWVLSSTVAHGAPAAGGDSGGSEFYYAEDGQSGALVGITFATGYAVVNGDTIAYIAYSSITNIEMDLDELTTHDQSYGDGSYPITLGPITPSTAAAPYNTVAYEVSITGGVAPFTCTWRINGSIVGTGSCSGFEYTNDGSDYTIEARATDAASRLSTSSFASITINVCYPYDCSLGQSRVKTTAGVRANAGTRFTSPRRLRSQTTHQ